MRLGGEEGEAGKDRGETLGCVMTWLMGVTWSVKGFSVSETNRRRLKSEECDGQGDQQKGHG